MSKPEIFIGEFYIDHTLLGVKGDSLKDHSIKEMAFNIGQAILEKFPPKEEYVYYSRINDGSYGPVTITDKKLPDDECRRLGIYLRDVRLRTELKICEV